LKKGNKKAGKKEHLMQIASSKIKKVFITRPNVDTRRDSKPACISSIDKYQMNLTKNILI